jgi:hypothetical protein
MVAFYWSKVCFDLPLNWSSTLLCRTDKGQTLKASYVHSVNPLHSVAAEMTHKLSSFENSFTIGSSHAVDPFTVVKTRFSDNGKAAMLCQHEWRPKSLITFSAEYDSKATHAAAPKFGLALALKPWMWNHLLFCSATWIEEHLNPVIFFPEPEEGLSFYLVHVGTPKDQVNGERFSSIVWEIEPNFDKLSKKKKTRDHNTIFCNWILKDAV